MMTVHPAVVETVIGLNMQQNSHGITQRLDNAGHMPCSDAVMRDIHIDLQKYASLQPIMVCADSACRFNHSQSIDQTCHDDS